jgi:hypothetical protein
MPRKIKDLAVKTGSYTDRNGETKNRYDNVGSILEMDDGGKMMLLKRSFNPAGVPHKEGSDQIIISVFDAKERDGTGNAPQAAAASRSAPAPAASAPVANGGGFDEEIPF